MRYVQRYDRKKRAVRGRVHLTGVADVAKGFAYTACGQKLILGAAYMYIGGAADEPRRLYGDCERCAKADKTQQGGTKC